MIDNDKFKQLRQKAEQKLTKITANLENVSDQSVERLLHELGVHQIELEMQNDELRKSYHDLNESRNMFHRLYKSAPVAYLIVNNFGQIGMVNDKFFELVGLPPATDIRGKSLADFIHFEDINLFYSIFKPFYVSPEKHKFELRFTKGDKIVYTDVMGYKYSNALSVYKDMQDFDLLIALHDVTKEKNLEDELNRKNKALALINETLQKRVDHETDQRIKHEQMLFEQKKFADMGEMLSSIAHQWRQPLNVLGLILQTIDNDYKNAKQEEIAELTKTGFDVITYLSETITDFRDFFKPAREKQAFNLAHASFNAMKLINKQIEENGLKISMSCSCKNKVFDSCTMENIPDCINDMPNITGYENEFKQVLLNLIYNARDAVMDNDKTDGYIKIIIDNKGEDLLIFVNDNGGGISGDISDKIFEPYFTTKADLNGTGLGLYMCKTIIEKHFHGKLSFENLDGGASFCICIPKS